MKKYCQEQTADGLKSRRILNAIRSKFDVPPAQIPSLAQVQNICNHYARSKLGNNDRFDEIQAMVRKHVLDKQTDGEAVIFTDQKDVGGLATLGDGTDESRFAVGVTTLLRRLRRAPAPFVLHVDATFKLSQLGCPVMVLGVSDRCHTFHLVALCVISQQTENVYARALESFQSVYAAVIGSPIRLAFVMGNV